MASSATRFDFEASFCILLFLENLKITSFAFLEWITYLRSLFTLINENKILCFTH